MVQNLFRNIENTIELRKEILQSSKEVIEILKSYQKRKGLNFFQLFKKNQVELV